MKNSKLNILTALTVGVVALCATAQAQPNALVTSNVLYDSTIQYSATLYTSFTNYVTGYDKVKYSTTTPCKSYFKFDFGTSVPNTNFGLKIALPAASSNNGFTHTLVWALNTAYPGFNSVNPGLAWTNAQANKTGVSDNDLTSGANIVADFTDPGSTATSFVTVPAPWGQFLFNNQIVLVLTATNDTSTGTTANGARFALGSTVTPPTATFQPLTAGSRPPTISPIPIAAQTIKTGTGSSSIPFVVGDPSDPANTLTNITLSINNTVNVSIGVTNITGPDNAGNCALTFTPTNNLAPGSTAHVTATLAVTDSKGNSASTTFDLYVYSTSLPYALYGTNINFIPPTNRVGNGSVIVPFQVGDTNAGITAGNLSVTAAVSPYSANLGSISVSTISTGANTNSYTVTVNTTGNGVGIVNLTMADTLNLLTNTVSLAVMQLPDSSYCVYDLMQYQPSSSYSSSSGHENLADASAGLWPNRSFGGSVDILTTVPGNVGGLTVGQPLLRGSGSGNQDQVQLVGGPFAPGSHKIVFASVNALWADLQIYGVNAYYPSNSIGAFLEFAQDSYATGNVMSAVCTIANPSGYSPEGTNANGSSTFYLGFYQGTNWASTTIPPFVNPPITNLNFSQIIPNLGTSGGTPNPMANIVVSYDVDTGLSSLWVNKGSSAVLPDITTTNVLLNAVNPTNQAVSCGYLVLRQNFGMGNILITNASVKVITKGGSATTPVITGQSYSGGNFIITYTGAPGSGGQASVVGSATVGGPYTTVAAGIVESPAGTFTATITSPSGSQNFYRIQQQASSTPPVTFPF